MRNPELTKWDEISSVSEWRSLLLGNGLSQQIHPNFNYSSLVEEYFKNHGDEYPIVKNLIEDLDSTNIEDILASVNVAIKVLESVSNDPSERERLIDIATSLNDFFIRAVAYSHPHWNDLRELNVFRQMDDALGSYERIYTTSFDLILYWMQNAATKRYADMIFSPGVKKESIDKNVAWADKNRKTPVFNLHGALHLYHDADCGVDRKWTRDTLKGLDSDDRESLSLITVAENLKDHPNFQPLFVAGGSSEQKVQKIQESNYLHACLHQLTEDDRNTVVFGQSLADVDDHIRRALDAGDGAIAYGIYTPPSMKESDEYVEGEMLRVKRALPSTKEIFFFDASTHPLSRIRNGTQS